MAREYQDAADELFAISDARARVHGHRQLDSPISFLYLHTAELALKAFLRSKNIPINGTPLGRAPDGHQLVNLYHECRKRGLVIGPNDVAEIGNIASLMDSGNKYQGFRYFNLESGATADLAWSRNVIADLMRTIEPLVMERQKRDNLGLGVRAKVTFVVQKPQRKTVA